MFFDMKHKQIALNCTC